MVIDEKRVTISISSTLAFVINRFARNSFAFQYVPE